MTGELREVYSAANIQDAHIIRAALENVGIEAHVVGDHLQNAIGELPAGAIAPRVWVHAEQLDQARTVIKNHLDHEQLRANSATKWKCAECGESNGPAFELCWKCQTARCCEP